MINLFSNRWANQCIDRDQTKKERAASSGYASDYNLGQNTNARASSTYTSGRELTELVNGWLGQVYPNLSNKSSS